MKKFNIIIGNLALLTSLVFGELVYRAGYSNGSNIHLKIKETSIVEVLLGYDLTLEDTDDMEPVLSSVSSNFSLSEKGYYVIRVNTLSDMFSKYLASN